MTIERGWVLACLIIGAVVAINVGLMYSLLSGGARQQWEILRKAARRARDPWQEEDRDLEELHRRVLGLGQDAGAGEDEAG